MTRHEETSQKGISLGDPANGVPVSKRFRSEFLEMEGFVPLKEMVCIVVGLMPRFL